MIEGATTDAKMRSRAQQKQSRGGASSATENDEEANTTTIMRNHGKIVFFCFGNTCRSPMAEIYWRYLEVRYTHAWILARAPRPDKAGSWDMGGQFGLSRE
jgi:hypothetical protein